MENQKAFPSKSTSQHYQNQNMTEHYGNEGMDLLDYFAAKAMQGILTSDRKPTQWDKGSRYTTVYSELAEISYAIAKYMMEEKENLKNNE